MSEKVPPSRAVKVKGPEIERSKFFDLSIDLLAVADTEGNFVKVNHAWKQVLGWEPEELLRDTFLSFVHPGDIKATLRHIQRQKTMAQPSNSLLTAIVAKTDHIAGLNGQHQPR